MAWYFNFCAPTLPNDPIINLHRYFQTGCLMGFMVLYIIVHIYYKMCLPAPTKQKQKQSETNSQSNSDGASEKEKVSEESSQNNDNNKTVSIAGGYGADENSSYVTFNIGKQKGKEDKNVEFAKIPETEANKKVTFEEIQSYFPIVFGHFSIGSAFSITYSPYAEQSIATALYILFSLLLLLLNSKRMIKSTRFVWGIMCFLICFLVMSGVLEVGQANYNKMRDECFSVNYQSLY